MPPTKNNKSKIKIYKFDPYEKDINGNLVHDLYNKIIVVLGPRDSGKSFFIKHLMKLLGKIPIAKIINGTEESTHHYANFNPDIFIEDEYNEEVLEKFIKRQKELYSKIANDKRYKGIDPRALLLLDDCLYDDSWTKSKLMRLIFMNGRWWGITFIVAMQTPLGIPPQLRGNIDYVFICKHPNPIDREKIFKNYVSGFKNRKEFEKVHDVCTDNYNVLVIKKTAQSSKLQDIVFHYKAQPEFNFKFGSPTIWAYHGKYYVGQKTYNKRKEEFEYKQQIEKEQLRKQKKKRRQLQLLNKNDLVVEKA